MQTELASKGEPSSARPTPTPMMSHAPPTAQRAIMNRHQQAQRNTPGLAPKLHTKQDGAPMLPHHHHTLSSGTSTSSQLASPSTTFSTPPTAHPHSGTASPSFSPHTEFYQPQQRLSGQFQVQQQQPSGPNAHGMPPFPYDAGQADPSIQQAFDYQSAPFQGGYEMLQPSMVDAAHSYPWMEQADYQSSGKLNPFLSPPSV